MSEERVTLPQRTSPDVSRLGQMEARGRRRDRYGSVVRVALSLFLVLLLFVTIPLRALQPAMGSDMIAAAAILGVSIIFAALSVSVVFLTGSRLRDVTEMREDLAEIDGHLQRGTAFGVAISQHQKSARLSA